MSVVEEREVIVYDIKKICLVISELSINFLLSEHHGIMFQPGHEAHG